MPNTLPDDLRKLLAAKKVLVIVSTGVSLTATRPAPSAPSARAASWNGLHKLGAQHCRALHPALDPAWENRLSAELDSGDLDDMLSAAEKIARKLGAPVGPEFAPWLEETVGALRRSRSAAFHAARPRNGGPAATPHPLPPQKNHPAGLGAQDCQTRRVPRLTRAAVNVCFAPGDYRSIVR